MLEIYKKRTSVLMSNEEINTKLSLLPEHLQHKISNYTCTKQQQRLEGFALLSTALKENQIDEKAIHSIQYNDFGKPFINDDVDFSISYSNSMTVLGFIKKGWVGVDIEFIKPIDCLVYKEYFTLKEWEFLTHNSYTATAFFQLWTRKEAVVKAIGKGIFLDFNVIDVLEDKIILENKFLYVSTKFLENYCLSIASSDEVILIV